MHLHGSMHLRGPVPCASGRLAGFFRQLGPAGIEGIVLILGGILFGERLLQRGGVGRDGGVFDAGVGRS